MPKLYAEVKYQRVLLRLFENQSDHSKPMIMKQSKYEIWEEKILKDSKVYTFIVWKRIIKLISVADKYH